LFSSCLKTPFNNSKITVQISMLENHHPGWRNSLTVMIAGTPFWLFFPRIPGTQYLIINPHLPKAQPQKEE
jgi:hypothetical protein